jgi:sulfonate transport system permease protein
MTQSILAPPGQATVRRTWTPRRLSLPPANPHGWLLGPTTLFLLWAAGSAAGLIDARVLPAPWVALETAWRLIRENRLQGHLAVSAWRAAQGLAIGTALGLVLALLSGLSRGGGYMIDGVVQIKRAVPSLALIPFFILWLGVGEGMKVAVIAIGAFTPIYIQTHNAISAIDLRYIELAEVTGLSRWGALRHVVLPGALPGFLLGLRFAVTAAWLGLVVVEQFNATSGIGYMINLARTYAQTDVMLVGVVLYALLGLASDRAVRALESRLLVWRRTLAGAARASPGEPVLKG